MLRRTVGSALTPSPFKKNHDRRKTETTGQDPVGPLPTYCAEQWMRTISATKFFTPPVGQLIEIIPNFGVPATPPL
jgi:hypothetical protein